MDTALSDYCSVALVGLSLASPRLTVARTWLYTYSRSRSHLAIKGCPQLHLTAYVASLGWARFIGRLKSPVEAYCNPEQLRDKF